MVCLLAFYLATRLKHILREYMYTHTHTHTWSNDHARNSGLKTYNGALAW